MRAGLTASGSGRRTTVRRRVGGGAALLAAAALVLVAACTPAPEPVGFPDGDGGVVTPGPAEVRGPVRLRGGDLVDAEGRTVQIHGMNLVRKSAPFHVSPDEPGFDETVEELRRAGFNGVRLGVWMAALMPEPGVVDTAYLDEVERGVEALSGAGLWVLLDLHQDVFVGMPEWATTPEAAALPSTVAGAEDLWFLSYFSPRSLRQWEDLYAGVEIVDGRSAIDLMGDGVATVAERFADSPNVIGIDLLNEPWPADAFLRCLANSCADRYQQLMDLYRSYTARIREVAPMMPVWIEPFNWGPPFQGVYEPGLDHVGLSFHSYCLHTDGGEPVKPSDVEHTLCGALYETQVDDARTVAGWWGAPAMLTEFGASASPLNTTRLTQLADVHSMSWFYWDDHYYRAASEIVRSDLTRVYPQATAGAVERQRFEPATGRFTMTYRPDPAVGASTVLVVPAAMYPDGYTVAVDGGRVTSPPDSGRLTVEADDGAAVVTVTVERRRSAGD
jgi:endoglycosylceramidase